MDPATHMFCWSGCEVTLGVLDATAVEAFTDGDCLTLAWALQQLAGGDIVAVVEHPGTDNELDTHYVVDTGNGRFIDVEGAATADVIVERWACRFGGKTPFGLRRGDMPPPTPVDAADIAAAATIAAVVIERHLQPAS